MQLLDGRNRKQSKTSIGKMRISKAWAMPNKHTFDIKPIKDLIERYYLPNSMDAFANKNRICQVTNDLDPQYNCDYRMDATDFMKMWPDGTFDFILYDPPYSVRQVSEVYKKMDMSVNMQTTQSSYWGVQKKEISRLLSPGGICITFGWNSNGIGKSNEMEQIEILIVAHGGWHNDTICTVERKT